MRPWQTGVDSSEKQLGGLEAALGKCFNFYSRVNLEIVLPSLKLTQINA